MIYWDEFQSYCMPIIVQKLLEEHGRDVDLLQSYSSDFLNTDYEFQSQWEALDMICDIDTKENEECYGYDYFLSDENIREFYKLCFEYSRFSSVKALLDSFNKVTDNNFCFDSYCYNLELPENAEQCLNCIKLTIDPEFSLHFELLEAMLDTQDYMQKALPELKFVIWQELYKEQCCIKLLPQSILREAA